MESRKSKWKWENLKKLKKPNKEQLAVILLCGVLLAVIAIPVSPENPSRGEDGQQETNTAETEGSTREILSYEEQLEQRLSEALSQVSGVGRTRVLITLETTGEQVVEKDEPGSSQTVQEKDASGGSRETTERSWSESTVYREESDGSKVPYVVKELEPQIQGVLVIAEGGGNPVIRQEILEAVEALFPIEAHKIKIMKMEGAK